MTTIQDVTAQELREWMARNGYTIKALTLALGMPESSMRTVQRWRDGTNRIPPYLALALASLEARPEPANPTIPTILESQEIERTPIED